MRQTCSLGMRVLALVLCSLAVSCPGASDNQQGQKGKRSSSGKVQVYAASPYGFAESTRQFMTANYYKAIADAGCEVVDPWRHTVSDSADLLQLGALNAQDLESADGVVAALDGSDVDSGTAAEIGYAAAKSKWVVGYRGDFRKAGEGAQVKVNLQVEYFIRQHGGTVVSSLEELTTALRKRC